MKQWTRTTIVAKLLDVIVEQLGVDDAEITLEASFWNDLGADSLDAIELVMALEKEFGIEIPDEDIPGPDLKAYTYTMGDAVDYLCKRLGV